MGHRRIDRIMQEGETVGSQTVTLIEYDLPDNSISIVYGKVIGRDTNGNAVVGETMRAVKKNNGVVSFVGASQTTLGKTADTALNASSFAITVNGLLRLTATGVVNTTINWIGILRIEIN